LVDIKGNLKKQTQNWRENWSMSVPADSQKMLSLKRDCKFKLKLKDELKVDLKHLVYYTLLWIACVDNHCNLHYVLKAKIGRYPRKIKWDNSEKKFWDIKVMHGWHPLAVQHFGYLVMEPGRFITEECLNKY